MIGSRYISACAWYNTENCYWVMSPKLWDLLYEYKLVEVDETTGDKKMKDRVVRIDPSGEDDYYVRLMGCMLHPELISIRIKYEK